jgi:hypothetical protein
LAANAYELLFPLFLTSTDDKNIDSQSCMITIMVLVDTSDLADLLRATLPTVWDYNASNQIKSVFQSGFQPAAVAS